MTNCPWDLNGDGVVDERDLNILITMWGPCVPGSKGDFNNDGVINADDIDILKANFGKCPEEADCPWDLNGDGVVDNDDVQWILDHWGPCVPGSKGDLNGDGVLNFFDIEIIKDHFGPCPGVAPPPQVCTPGAKRCRDANTVEQCRADGSGWDVVQACGAGFECKIDKCVATSTPGTETRTVSLTEGQHTIQVSLSGYDTLNATINVSSTGVACVSVIGGACGGSSLPRVSASGWTVTTYLKSGAVATNRCTWIATKDTSKVAFISEMVLAYNKVGVGIGFVPTAAEIGDAVLMYVISKTPAELWGC